VFRLEKVHPSPKPKRDIEQKYSSVLQSTGTNSL